MMMDAKVSASGLRAAMSHLASGVVLVTGSLNGADIGTTVTALCTVSLDPPLVLVSLIRGSRMHEALIRPAAGPTTFAISVLNAEDRDVAARFAARGRPNGLSNFADLSWHRGAATGHVLLDDALAHIECTTREQVPAGDHTVLFGEVLTAAPNPDSREPLLRFRSEYRILPNG